jgi:membrane associated rhomboid family serine protease
MLYDRPYMRGPSLGNEWWRSATWVLLVANLVVFVLQSINQVYIRWPVRDYLELSREGLAHGYLWQLLTFQFLHAGPTHFVINELMLFIFGKTVEETIGRSRFLEVYFASGFVGGLLQILMGLLMGQVFPAIFGASDTSVVGASASIFGLIAVFSLLQPDRLIYLWFVVPIPAKFFVLIAAAISIFYILVPLEPQVAHVAHLGGIVAGILYLQWFIRPERRLFDWRRYRSFVREPELVVSGVKRQRFNQNTQLDIPKDLPPEEFISREVDPILDKISAHGIHSLTARERAILEAARKKMARR